MRESAVFIWRDRALFVGDRSETSLHSHHAIELAIALDDSGIHMGSADGATLRGVAGALVHSNARHRLSIPGPKVAVLYVDALSAIGTGLHAWLGHTAIARLPENLLATRRGAFAGLFQPDRFLAEARQVTDDLLSAIVPLPSEPSRDERIERAVASLESRLDAPPTQAELAAHVGLSASRLGHLFKAQLGLPMRRYILWLRLRAAVTEALAGGDMTRAAHTAGFSDAAHFTRTCRRMFGLPPSAFAPVDAVFVAD